MSAAQTIQLISRTDWLAVTLPAVASAVAGLVGVVVGSRSTRSTEDKRWRRERTEAAYIEVLKAVADLQAGLGQLRLGLPDDADLIGRGRRRHAESLPALWIYGSVEFMNRTLDLDPVLAELFKANDIEQRPAGDTIYDQLWRDMNDRRDRLADRARTDIRVEVPDESGK